MSEVPRFVADVMLGKLARWLRVLGYDTLYDRKARDEELVRLCRQGSRILLTRDRDLCSRRGVQVLLVESDELDSQLQQVISIYPFPCAKPRCPSCNSLLQEVDKFAVEGLVPTYVWVTQECFQLCPCCGRVLWKGSHWHGILARLRVLACVHRQPH